MKKHITPITASLLVAVGIVVMGTLLCQRYGEVLIRMQDLSLFLPTRLFYRTSCIYPGGTLTWAAAYMTQFFCHPALGATLLSAAWALIALLLCRLYRLQGAAILFSLLAPMALLAALTQTGYWIYYIKLQGYAWVPTLGTLASLLLLVPARFTKGWWRCLYIVLIGIAGYPLMGMWSFLAIVLLGTTHYADAKRGQHITYLVLALLMIGIVPQVCYQWMYTQTMQSHVYTAAMPPCQLGKIDFREFRYAYYALALSFVPAVLTGWLKKRKEWHVALVAALLLAFACWGVESRWYRDTNYLKEVAMANAIERLDWEGVLRIMKENNKGESMPPTRAMVMEKNLALFRLGRAGDEMFHYPEGSEQYCLCGAHCATTKVDDRDTLVHLPADKKFSHIVAPIHITQVAGKLLYYFYGKEQFCYRWCMEDGVEFGWNQNVLKYMAKSSLVAQEWEVARKYLDLLDMTRYNKDWVKHYRTFIRHPELMEQDEEMKPIIPMSVFTDRLDGDKTLVELYLLRTFSSGTGVDVYYQEMTLICAMLMKDINLFWPRFKQYIAMHVEEEGIRVPLHYQEAAYLYTMLEPQKQSELWPQLTNIEALQYIPFDPNVKQSYENFMNFNTRCGVMSEEQKKKAFYPQFGNTFYYYYFLVRNQKTN